MLDSPEQVIRSILRYTDWWQPATSSVITVSGARRTSDFVDGFSTGLVATLDVRTELCRRIAQLDEVDRELLVLWYVGQLVVDDISKALGISRRQCFRRRARAIRRIVELGETTT